METETVEVGACGVDNGVGGQSGQVRSAAGIEMRLVSCSFRGAK